MSRGLNYFKSNYVYRVLRPNEDPNNDLTCVNSHSSCTIDEHVESGLHTPTRYIYRQARFACLRCAAGGHFVSAGGSLRSPGVTLVNYKGDNISKYVCPTVLIDITRKITKFVNFKIFDA